MKKPHMYFLIMLLVGIISSCNSINKSTLPMGTEIVTLVPTTTPTVTMTPTFTPTSTHTPIPTPTAIGGGAGQFILSAQNSYGEPGIYIYNFLTGEMTILLEEYDLQDVSPDGHKMLVSPQLDMAKREGNPSLEFAPRSLFVCDIDGSNLQQISSEFQSMTTYSIQYYDAGWLTGTDLIIFKKQVDGLVQLFTYNPAGEIKQITSSSVGVFHFIPQLLDGGIYWMEGQWKTEGYNIVADTKYGWKHTNIDDGLTIEFDWDYIEMSPDGEYIAFLGYPEETSNVFYNTAIITDIQGTKSIELIPVDYVENPSGTLQYGFSKMKWSPNNEYLFLLLVGKAGKYSTEYYKEIIVSKDGELIHGMDFNFQPEHYNLLSIFSWSPDGRQMLGFEYKKRDGNLIIHQTVDFGQPQEIVIPSEIAEKIFRFDSVYWLP